MRTTKVLLGTLLSVVALGAACADDDTEVGTGDGTDSPSTVPVATVPDRPADLVGTITAVTAFVPITEDCTPLEDLESDAVSSDDPPVCSDPDTDVLGTVLVEEQPDADDEGRKISYTVTTATALAGSTADGSPVRAFDDLAVGQSVDSWVPEDGACAESYPEQCGAAALRVTG
jgi:hypothetical protein